MKIYIELTNDRYTTDERYQNADQIRLTVKHDQELLTAINVMSKSHNITHIYLSAHGEPGCTERVFTTDVYHQEHGFLTITTLGRAMAQLMQYHVQARGDVVVKIVLQVCFSADSFNKIGGWFRPIRVNIDTKHSLMDRLRRQINITCTKQYKIKGYTGRAVRRAERDKYLSAGRIDAINCYQQSHDLTIGKQYHIKQRYNWGKTSTINVDEIYVPLTLFYGQPHEAVDSFICAIHRNIDSRQVAKIARDCIIERWDRAQLYNALLTCPSGDVSNAASVLQWTGCRFGGDNRESLMSRAVYMDRDGNVEV
jgi:hypothetical protein